MIEKTSECPECSSTNFSHDVDKGQIVCEDCGQLIEEGVIDKGREWREFNPEDRKRKARAGSPLTFMKPDKGLTTQIDRFNVDSKGNKIPTSNRSQMYSIRNWHNRVTNSSSMERNLKTALRELKRIKSSLRLPNQVAEETAKTYRKAVKKGLTRGRLIEEVLVATLYAVCRKRKIPRTLKELSEVSGVERNDIGKTYRFLKKELDIDVPLPNPVCYVPRFASKLNLNGKVEEEAKELLRKVMDEGLISGRGPTGIAAAALYIAGVKLNQRRTQKEIAEAAGITEVTIRNRYNEIKEEINLDLKT